MLIKRQEGRQARCHVLLIHPENTLDVDPY